jgi:Meiotically up-regulated gene 113
MWLINNGSVKLNQLTITQTKETMLYAFDFNYAGLTIDAAQDSETGEIWISTPTVETVLGYPSNSSRKKLSSKSFKAFAGEGFELSKRREKSTKLNTTNTYYSKETFLTLVYWEAYRGNPSAINLMYLEADQGNVSAGDRRDAGTKIASKKLKDRKHQSVYIFQCSQTGVVKIGISCNVSKRLSAIQTGYPFLLTVVRTIETEEPRKMEQKLHKALDDFRLKGEWFDGICLQMIAP